MRKQFYNEQVIHQWNCQRYTTTHLINKQSDHTKLMAHNIYTQNGTTSSMFGFRLAIIPKLTHGNINPTIVIVLGATHRGTRSTQKEANGRNTYWYSKELFDALRSKEEFSRSLSVFALYTYMLSFT